MPEPRLEEIRALVEPILAERALELVELTCRPQGWQQHLRFLVDKVGGVTIQECARANELVGRTLEAADLIEGSYTIEVSSPGLDRPLVSKRDFERALGDQIRVEAQREGGRVESLEGMLLAVQHEAIVLKTPSGNVTVPFTQVKQGKKAVRW